MFRWLLKGVVLAATPAKLTVSVSISVVVALALVVMATVGAPRRSHSAEEEPAGPAQDRFPRIEGQLSVEIQNDWTYDASKTINKLNDLYTTTEADLNLYPFSFVPELFLNSHFTLEPVKDPRNGENRFFEDHGLYVEALQGVYDTGEWFAAAGKFGVNFSIAYDRAPGIYGADIAEDDIEIAERIGFAVGYAFDEGPSGTHTVSASTFFADTSDLSRSAFEDRGRTRLRDGGPSNTERLESFAVALDGTDMQALPGFAYHLGFVRQDVNRVVDGGAILDSNETADEHRVAAAATWSFDVTDHVALTPLLEYVRFWNAEGVEDEARDYLTASVLLERLGWNLAFATTQRRIHPAAGSDSNDWQFQVSAGYRFDFGLGIDVGWRYLTEDGDVTRTLGALASYAYEF